MLQIYMYLKQIQQSSTQIKYHFYYQMKANHSKGHSSQKQPNLLTQKEQLELQLMFDGKEMNEYFTKENQKSKNHPSPKNNYVEEGIEFVYNQICSGFLTVKESPENVEEYFIHEKISKQEEKALQLKIKKQQILLQLQYLDMQTNSIKSSSSTIVPDIKLHILTKEEHEQFIEKVMKDRQHQDKKHERIVERLEKSRVQSQKKEKQKIQNLINRKREKRVKRIERSLQKKKQLHQQILANELKTRKQYERVKNTKFLHEEIEERYQSNILMPVLQQRKRKLKEIRTFAKEFSVENIKKHEQEYLEKKHQNSSIKSRIQDQWNYKAPPKTQKLTQFLEEQKINQKRELEEKKMFIQQKLKKQENFIQYLRSKFKPRIDERKKNQLEERIKKTTNKRKQSANDGKLLGISYLQQAKRLRKRTIDVPQQIDKITQQTSEKPDYLEEMRKKHNYQSIKKHRLERLLEEPQTDAQKIKFLQMQSQKLQQAYKRKQLLGKVTQDQQTTEDALDLLITNIKTKIGIFNAYQNS